MAKCLVEVFGKGTLLIMGKPEQGKITTGYRLAGPKAYGQQLTARIEVDLDELIREATLLRDKVAKETA